MLGGRATAAPAWRELREDRERAERWQAAADEIHADICAHGVDERGVFTQHYETTALDAVAAADAAACASCRPTTERVRNTVLAIADELTEDGLVLRYRVEETDDGLQRRGGHVHDLLVLAGLRALSRSASSTARGRCASSCSRYASPLGLYAEEIDPRTGRHLGNFPQAFTHLALINAVMHVIRAEREEQER